MANCIVSAAGTAKSASGNVTCLIQTRSSGLLSLLYRQVYIILYTIDNNLIDKILNMCVKCKCYNVLTIIHFCIIYVVISYRKKLCLPLLSQTNVPPKTMQSSSIWTVVGMVVHSKPIYGSVISHEST